MTLPASPPISLSQVRTELQMPGATLAQLAAAGGKSPTLLAFLGFSLAPLAPLFGASWASGPSRVVLSWSSGGGAEPQTYDVQRSATADFASPTQLATATSTTSLDDPQSQLASLSRTLYYRVRANAQGKQSPWVETDVVIPPASEP